MRMNNLCLSNHTKTQYRYLFNKIQEIQNRPIRLIQIKDQQLNWFGKELSQLCFPRIVELLHVIHTVIEKC